MDMAAILHGLLKMVNKFNAIDFSGRTPGNEHPNFQFLIVCCLSCEFARDRLALLFPAPLTYCNFATLTL